jgi:hypothetical protein
MDAPALRACERLMARRLGTEKGTDFINEATKASGAMTVCEPTHGPIAWLNAPMVWLCQDSLKSTWGKKGADEN